MTIIESLGRILTCKIDAADAALEKFHQDMKENPARALRWADDVFLAAAEKELNQETLNELREAIAMDMAESYVENKIAEVTREIVRSANSLEAASSPSANLLAQQRKVAQARLLETLQKIGGRL